MADVHFFDESNPFTMDKLNDSLANIVGAINALAQDSLLTLTPAAGADGSLYVPVAGGAFAGQISAPSVVQGPVGGPYSSLIAQNALDAVNTLGTTASGTYTQAELQAVIDKLDALITALKA